MPVPQNVPQRRKWLTYYLPLAIVVGVPVVVIFTFLWLALSAEDTISRRALKVPSITVTYDANMALTEEEFQAYLAEAKQAKAEHDLTQDVTQDPPVTPLATGEGTPPAPEPDGTAETEATEPEPEIIHDKVEKMPRAGRQPGVGLPTVLAEPVDGLFEITGYGPVPVVAQDGSRSWRVYRNEETGVAGSARIALIIENVGLNTRMAERLIVDLPETVTLAFTPYAIEVERWMALARADGHETLMGLPMEPRNYPQDDPGPRALMLSYDQDQNQNALLWALGRGTNYVGVMPIFGDGFTEEGWRIDPIMRELKRRGLLYVGASSERGIKVTGIRAKALRMPYAAMDKRLDTVLSKASILAALKDLEKKAEDQKIAVAVARPYPVVVEALQEWMAGLNSEEISLIPLSVAAEITLQQYLQ